LLLLVAVAAAATQAVIQAAAVVAELLTCRYCNLLKQPTTSPLAKVVAVTTLAHVAMHGLVEKMVAPRKYQQLH
jgi:hypothetical protein